MNNERQFTASILKELSNRLNIKNKNIKPVNKLLSLESLLNKNLDNQDKNTHYVKNNDEKLEKQIYTEKDLEKMGSVDQITIKKGDIVTPLAKDFIKRNRIKLIVKKS